MQDHTENAGGAGKDVPLTNEEMTLGKRISFLRKAKRLTQREFAEKLNVSDKLVSKWELEESSPAVDDVVRIGAQFGLSLDYLIHGKKSARDEEALKPVPAPPPPFSDPVQAFVNHVNTLIEKNRWQPYREQLFPASAEQRMYAMMEEARKETLKTRHAEYTEDLRGKNKPIDEDYWNQLYLSFGEGTYQADFLPRKVGVFLITSTRHRSLKSYYEGDGDKKWLDYGIDFALDFNALLALDNFDIFSALTSEDPPQYFRCLIPEVPAAAKYFGDSIYRKENYREFFDKHTHREYSENERLKKLRAEWDEPFYERNYGSGEPLSYLELAGLTDLRFFRLLEKQELDLLLGAVNTKHERAWEVIASLIDCGATKVFHVRDDYSGSWNTIEDPLGTLALRTIAELRSRKPSD